jgi:amino acid adenylation domain-containing protein
MTAFTVVPRWTRSRVNGVAEHEVTIPLDFATALHRLSTDLGVPLSALLLTAHLKVLVALSGEVMVCTGYATRARPARALRASLDGRTWRELVLNVARADAAMRSPDSPEGDDFDAESGDVPFETVFSPVEVGGELDPGVVLRVGFAAPLGTLRLRYRTDVLDTECAERIAGYHIAALSLMMVGPDAEHERQSLLSAEERGMQVYGLAGRRRELPVAAAHELFAARARTHPDAVAVVHGAARLTYGQLDARANRLAHALLARGLTREAVVGVVTERNLDWITAVLAILKAGGAYLPVEPHFPPDRIATMLRRADCRIVLTDQGSDTLDRALESFTGIERLGIAMACAESHPSDDPAVTVSPDQLAYIFFTSGSTGEPKGAMCEHAGLVNHLFAKIDDLGIGAGDVVAETAPQCFDISMWQLLSALLSGGRTLIVEQEVILDAARFLDTIVEGKVNVLQVVPSYLDVLVSSLAQHPRTLADLRVVSATGEALKKELVQRWFDVQPGIRLLNAYGLTETSDDTNHELLDRAPEGDRVPLGRPVNNVTIYVVDEQLAPVPLGAPGEIVFSGVCVGRGYINDPERTRRAFLVDPHRAGQRIYRSGDYGRWRPDGKLEFLGRRDAQVKVNGFRIEIGEVENRLLGLPGVRDGAVIATERPDRSKQLIAFYTAELSLDPASMRRQLNESLPSYMVPAAFHWRETLPVTENGKVDRKALTRLAGLLEPEVAFREPPSSVAERRLASLWAAVLGVPEGQVGRRDDFFDLGGTSLSALRLAISLGRALAFKDIAEHPVLADQAELAEARGALATIPALAPDFDCAAASVPQPAESTV